MSDQDSMDEELVDAVNSNDVERVKELLDRGASKDARNDYGSTVLMIASISGYVQIADILVRRGAELEQTDSGGWTALTFAAWKGHQTILDMLIKFKAAVRHMDKVGRTAFSVAMKCARWETAGLLALAMSCFDDLPVNEYLRLVTWACRSQHSEITRHVCKQAASTQWQTKDGDSVLMLASARGDDNVVEMMIAYGANVDHRNKTDEAALDFALNYDHMSTAGQLVLKSHAFKRFSIERRSSVFRWASKNGRVDVARKIVEEGDGAAEFAILNAIIQGDVEETKSLLLASSSLVNARLNENEWTPFLLASRNGHVPVMQLLTSLQCNVEARDSVNNGALGLASVGGHVEAVNFLLENGHNVNDKQEAGRTALQLAEEVGHYNVAKLLKRAQDQDLELLSDWNEKKRTGTAQAVAKVASTFNLNRSHSVLLSQMPVHLSQLKWQVTRLFDIITNEIEPAGMKIQLFKSRLEILQDSETMRTEVLHGSLVASLGSVAVESGDSDVACLSRVDTRQVAMATAVQDLAVASNVAVTAMRLKQKDLLEKQVTKLTSHCEQQMTDIQTRLSKLQLLVSERVEQSLCSAVSRNDVEKSEKLLEGGANPNVVDKGPDKNQTSLLQVAAVKGSVEMVKLLLRYNADVNYRDKAGKTALQSAEEMGHYDVAKLLKQAQGQDSELPFDQNEKKRTVKSILDHLGPEGRALYEEACQDGTVTLTHVLINVMGEEDAGKSCFVDSIANNAFVPERPSTKGLKMRTIVRTLAGNKQELEEVDNKKLESVVNNFFAKNYVMYSRGQSATQTLTLSQRQDAIKPESYSHDQVKELATEPHFTGSADGDKQQDQLSQLATKSRLNGSAGGEKQRHQSYQPSHDDISVSALGHEEFMGVKNMDEEMAVLISQMMEDEKEMRKCDEIIIMTVMDRGGQDQYLSIHAALTPDMAHNVSIAFIVMDGTKPLDKTVTKSKFRLPDGNVMEQERDVATTGVDLIRHWATAMEASCPYNADSPSPFIGMNLVVRPLATFLLATRKDQTNGEGKAVDRQEEILKDVISEQCLGDHVVYSRKDPYSVLFHIDNTKSGTGNPDSTVMEITNMIFDMTREFWHNQPTPVRWAMLGKGLKRMAMSKHRVIALQDVCRIARQVCKLISDEECREALRYLCSLGSICFYHDIPGLSDKVFPNVQWVADVMSVFVTVLDKRWISLPLWHDLETLQNDALMTWKLAQSLLKDAGVEKADYGVILRLLHLFNIISASSVVKDDAIVKPNQSFFVPCMVVNESISGRSPEYQSAICSSSCPPPLFLTPMGMSSFLKPLFYRLICRMITVYNSKPELSRNQVIFHLLNELELELFYTTKAVIATVYPADPKNPPSEDNIRQQCITCRDHLVKELTDAKRRGMDGFQFELCVHPTLKSESSDINYEMLASFNCYPTDILVSQRGKRILEPKQLNLWYPHTQTAQLDQPAGKEGHATQAAGSETFGRQTSSQSGSSLSESELEPLVTDLQILEVAKTAGHKWLEIGEYLGLQFIDMKDYEVKHPSLYQRLVEVLVDWRRREETATVGMLLAACKKAGMEGAVIRALQKLSSSGSEFEK